MKSLLMFPQGKMFKQYIYTRLYFNLINPTGYKSPGTVSGNINDTIAQKSKKTPAEQLSWSKKVMGVIIFLKRSFT